MAGFILSDKPLTPSEASIAGACSGFTTRAFVSPLDVLKIRLQLQVQSTHKKQTCRSRTRFIGSMRNMYKFEGIQAFWKGHVPSQLLAISFTGVQFGVFEHVSNKMWKFLPDTYHTETYKSSVSFVCGSIAGAAASVVTQPLDTIRTRVVMQRKTKVYKHVLDAFVKVTKDEGMLGLWRGTLPNILQIVPRAGIQFGAYSALCSISKRLKQSDKISPVQSLYCGALSGVLAKFLTLPLDLTKKRLQVQGFTEVIKQSGLSQIPTYTGFVHCVLTVYTSEGVRGFFKGATPSLIKAFVGTGLTFAAYNFYSGVMVVLRDYY